MMDIVALAVGFGIGVVVVAIAIEFGTKKEKISMPNTRRTREWSIHEIQNPKIIAEYLGACTIPKDSRVIVHRYKDLNSVDGVMVRKNAQIKGNYVLGDDRALLLSGPLKDGELGFWTVEKEIVKSLHDEFDRYWYDSISLDPKDKK